MTAATLDFHPLSRADGSANFTSSTASVLAAVHAPLDPPASRRDEQPASALLDVHIRPAHGVGGPRFRRLESTLASLLRAAVALDTMPRALVRLALQITESSVPISETGGSLADAMLLPALTNASFLALLDAAVPLRTSIVADAAVVTADGEVIVSPAPRDIAGYASVHAMAFSRAGDLLLEESIGEFSIEVWKQVVQKLKDVCVSAMNGDTAGAHGMETDGAAKPWLKAAVEANVKQAGAWRTTV